MAKRKDFNKLRRELRAEFRAAFTAKGIALAANNKLEADKQEKTMDRVAGLLNALDDAQRQK